MSKKQQAHNNTGKKQLVLRAKNINLTYRMTRQGYLTLSIPEIEIWREQP